MRTKWHRELIPFSNAVQQVYTKIAGNSSAFGGPLLDRLLDEVAQAMAGLVTIYGAPNDQLPVMPLSIAAVEHGAFQRAATLIRTSNGIEYGRLHVRRCDVLAAATVLKKSGARFASDGELRVSLESTEVRCEAAS